MGDNPARFEEKLPPAKLPEATGVPVPLGKPADVLYSIPYAVMAEQPVEVIVPAQVAELVVMALAAPVVKVGIELTPDPVAATLIAEAPPPEMLILPL